MTDYLREFEFLPDLPKSNLDDRSFEELVQECILRIPRYCPEWTNHNPGDPGVTLIELFAWLTKQMLFRFNQVPRRNYVAFLELLGIRLQPPAPAQTELTFYLTRSQSEPKRIPSSTEVATVRTETEEAVVFTTERDLVIGQPQIKHLLRSVRVEDRPVGIRLNNLFTNTQFERDRHWENLDSEILLFETCQPGNCFYLVLEPSNIRMTNTDQFLSTDTLQLQDAIAGNVLEITFRGPAAVTTGIRPDDPPLRWEAWNGERWQPGILRQKVDDKTKGFSFSELGQQGGPNPEREGADLILHLPQDWAEAEFGNYRGYWIRCVYTETKGDQYHYSHSPVITGMSVQAIGGTIDASECTHITDELLGVSDGKAGQTFYLEGKPILQRQLGEYIQIRLPNGEIQDWQEVSDFGDSTASDRHYMIDSLNGTVQFGPLIREPSALQLQTYERAQLQAWGKRLTHRTGLGDDVMTTQLPAVLEDHDRRQEWQYGHVPPLGAEIWMTAYRVGGGSRGNVQKEKLTVLKTAIPYIKRVVNYKAAEGGTEPESLDEAVMRVPAILRNRKTALTPEDFEHTVRQMPASRPLHRVHCVTAPQHTTPGVVRLLIVPGQHHLEDIDFSQGMHPDQAFALDRELQQEIQDYLDEHKALGIQVKAGSPDYVGVKVVAEVLLESQYNTERDRTELRNKIVTALYRFLNPLTGGFDRCGWSLGRPLNPSDIVAFCQDLPEVRYVGSVQLFSIRRHRQEDATIWHLSPNPEPIIHPGDLGILCSWGNDPDLETEHTIEYL
jgi:predicted phage baseplate assembly protein